MSDKGIMVIVRFWIIALCVAWVGVAGWREFVSHGDLFDIRGTATRSGGSSCSGSFSNRYECRSSRIISIDNAIFVSWAKRIAVVFVPPMALLYLFGKYARRREDQEAERVRQAVLKRKRAQRESELEHNS
ncbi:MAG: hypothetical protein O7I42_12995 [Alphaproteobacteria bacterium]|nr:hypothetical protein [Alphaproteobacteria bacterium]